MKNYERYMDEIKNFDINKSFCDEFVLPYILNISDCSKVHCGACRLRQTAWLLEEYEEPEIDWNKVEVDTPILVKDMEYENWRKRYFAEYKDEVVYAWVNGKTSWSAVDDKDVTTWNYAKLAESEEK